MLGLEFLVSLCLTLKQIFCFGVIFEQVAEELFPLHASQPLCHHSSRTASQKNSVLINTTLQTQLDHLLF